MGGEKKSLKSLTLYLRIALDLIHSVKLSGTPPSVSLRNRMCHCMWLRAKWSALCLTGLELRSSFLFSKPSGYEVTVFSLSAVSLVHTFKPSPAACGAAPDLSVVCQESPTIQKTTTCLGFSKYSLLFCQLSALKPSLMDRSLQSHVQSSWSRCLWFSGLCSITQGIFHTLSD